MKTFAFPLLFLLLLVSACDSEPEKQPQQKPPAVALNDSATKISARGDSLSYAYADMLYDEAVSLDSNYYIAYWNKLACETELHFYAKALATARELIRLRPGNPDHRITAGMLAQHTGDTALAEKYYDEGIALFRSITDTSPVTSRKYYSMMTMYGLSLIVAYHTSEGDSVLAKVIANRQDTLSRNLARKFYGKSRDELIAAMEGKQ
ncbi:MAG TPA: hypothetical protein VFU15_14995 [Bacteroidia bacterium]|nr:hypothetical protein [Bacteroidia bacterium]